MKRMLVGVGLFFAMAGSAQAASPGAPGVGDRLYPLEGNGGYDVQHYDVDLTYGAKVSDPVNGTVNILARATQSLSRFDLDYSGQSVGAVSVNGAAASFRRDGQELVITPRKALANGSLFIVSVKYVAVPTPAGDDPTSTAFFIHDSGTATAPQPDLARYFLPSNDHPSDKASYDIRFDVPAQYTAVANGVQVLNYVDRGRRHALFVQRQPMATELVQLAVGNYDVTNEGFHNGVFLREVTSRPLTQQFLPLLDVTASQLDYMQARAGDYPFDLYGSLVVQAGLGFALETQTLELIDTNWYTDFGQGTWDATLIHEMSHMWFGDSVAPATWSDLWLNEGHASWYEFTWGEENGVLEEDTEGYPDDNGYATLDELMKAVYAHGDEWRASAGPVALPSSPDELFAYQRYHGGALVLYALRQKVGAATFQRIEKAYTSRFRDGNASTDQWIALAAQTAGRPDLVPFLRDWLYGTKTPPMPGHPDWTVNPVSQQKTLVAPGRRARK